MGFPHDNHVKQLINLNFYYVTYDFPCLNKDLHTSYVLCGVSLLTMMASGNIPWRRQLKPAFYSELQKGQAFRATGVKNVSFTPHVQFNADETRNKD